MAAADKVSIKVMLRFPPDLTGEPVTYKLIKDYDIIFNILHAEVAPGKKGRLTLELIGTPEDLEKGIAYLADSGIDVKVFTKSIIWNEDKCVHCGACTGVCPSGALYIDPSSAKLTFDRQKCMVCELCTRACPLSAIDVDMFS